MDTLALILSIIGCVNWGLVGIFQFDLVAWLFGAGSLFSRLVLHCCRPGRPLSISFCSAEKPTLRGIENGQGVMSCPFFQKLNSTEPCR